MPASRRAAHRLVVARRDLRRDQPGRQVDRRLPADLRNAEAGEDPRQRPPDARPLDPAVEVLGALLREPVERHEVLDRQPEEVAAPLARDRARASCASTAQPAPSMSIARHEMAELLADARRAGEVRAVVADGALVADDRRAADRAAAGMSYSRSAPVRFSTIGRTTSGITSPAFWRITWSPIRMSLRRTSSRLCSVARATVEPATLVGVRCATGVSVPVRPTYGDDVLDERSRPAPAGTCRRSPSAAPDRRRPAAPAGRTGRP